MAPGSNSQDEILDAAEAVVLEQGAGHLTLDAVAAKAGKSKGGVLYHFPTKEKLLQRMVERLHENFEAVQAEVKRAKRVKTDLQAFVMGAVEDSCRQRKVCSAVIAAAANNPALLKPARQYNQKKFRQLAAGSKDPVFDHIIVLATHGLWLMELLETSPLTKSERKKIVDRLMKLCGESGH